MVAIAGGDVERLGRLREIDSWFPKAKELNDEVFVARVVMDSEELSRCFLDFQAQPAMVVLLWAMLEEESPNPAKQFKWAAFRSHIYGLLPPPAAPMEVVMGLPAPGMQEMSIEIADEEERVLRRTKAKGGGISTPFPSLRTPLRENLGPLPSDVGVSPAGSRFWLLAGVDSDDEGEGSPLASSGISDTL